MQLAFRNKVAAADMEEFILGSETKGKIGSGASCYLLVPGEPCISCLDGEILVAKNRVILVGTLIIEVF